MASSLSIVASGRPAPSIGDFDRNGKDALLRQAAHPRTPLSCRLHPEIGRYDTMMTGRMTEPRAFAASVVGAATQSSLRRPGVRALSLRRQLAKIEH
jgi:hypothetical protein